MDDKNLELKIQQEVSKTLTSYVVWAAIIALWIFALNSH